MEKVLTIKKLREIIDAIPTEKDELFVCYPEDGDLVIAVDANIDQRWLNNIKQDTFYIY